MLTALLLSSGGQSPVIESQPIDQPAPGAASEEPASGAVMLKDFHRSESKDGQLVWEVRSARGQYFPLSNSAKVEDALVQLYRKDGSAVKVAAGEAVLEMDGAELSRVQASRGVKLVYNSEFIVDTEAAVFDRATNRITAPGEVRITSSMIDTTGIGLTADLEKRTASLDKEVQSVIKARERDNEGKN